MMFCRIIDAFGNLAQGKFTRAVKGVSSRDSNRSEHGPVVTPTTGIRVNRTTLSDAVSVCMRLLLENLATKAKTYRDEVTSAVILIVLLLSLPLYLLEQREPTS